jgi:hypothetical protein
MLSAHDVNELMNGAKCTGKYKLFDSTSRADSALARAICAGCPVVKLCLEHVDPSNSYYNGTCAGRLWYDGYDVTDIPSALPPPVFVSEDMSPAVVSAALEGSLDELEEASDTTLMTFFWASKFTQAKLMRITGLSKHRVMLLVRTFKEDAPPEVKDWAADLASG